MRRTSSTSSSRRHLAKSIIFLLGLVLLLGAVQFVVFPRHDRDKLWMDYRSLPAGSVDVLFLGTSLIHANVNPAVLWEATGIRAYDLSGSEQSLLTTLPYLKEAVRTQDPKVVVLDLHMLSQGNMPLSENQKRSNLTMMPFGAAKLRAISSATPAPEWAMYVSPLQQFHSRWSELRRRDFNPAKWDSDSESFYLGYRMTTKVVAQKPDTERRALEEAVYARNYTMISEIIQLAQEEDAEVLLVVGPSSRVNLQDKWIARLKPDLARDFPNVRLLETQLRTREMGVGYGKDYYDELHLNSRGAEKYSAWLGRQIATQYDLPRDGSAQLNAAWRTELARYRETLKDN